MDEKITVKMLDGKSLDVTFPTDEQWKERQRSRKITVRQLGRGQSETKVSDGDDGDLALLAAISGGPNGFETAEASMILNQLSLATVDEVERDGDEFKVSLRTYRGESQITVKMPSAKQVLGYRRSFVRLIDLPYNQQEMKLNIQAAADLFDELCPEQKATSIVHKVPVVGAVVAEIDRLLEPSSEGFPKGS